MVGGAATAREEGSREARPLATHSHFEHVEAKQNDGGEDEVVEGEDHARE